jgi:hypothetical protein
MKDTKVNLNNIGTTDELDYSKVADLAYKLKQLDAEKKVLLVLEQETLEKLSNFKGAFSSTPDKLELNLYLLDADTIAGIFDLVNKKLDKEEKDTKQELKDYFIVNAGN